MKLLIDLGNSRLKVAVPAPGGRIRLLGEARHREAGVEAALATALQGVGPQDVTGVLCANVAGGAAGHALEEALQARGWGRPDFLRARPEACGVRCAYAEPARLGADRWAALLGARSLTEGACLVVDAGSALTIDAMAPGGLHLGGWIIAGLGMMLEALESSTGDLRALRLASAGVPLADFPADSGPAMEGGVLLAAAGAVRVARERLEARSGVVARLLVTGGDARALLPALAGAEHAPELVLQGLARAAGGRQGGPC